MIVCALQSGSSGNCWYVEAGRTRLLVDAGISPRQVKRRLDQIRRPTRPLDGLLISHEHSDHAAHAGALSRLLDVPLYMTRSTHDHLRSRIGSVGNVEHFVSTRPFMVGTIQVTPLATTHDAADGVAFILESSGKRLGIFSDLGSPFLGLVDALRSVDAAYIESNYDEQMLQRGSYPPVVKQRVRGPGGHLSNVEAAAVLKEADRSWRWISLAHISAHNNTVDLALEVNRAAIGSHTPVHLTYRDQVAEVLVV